MLPYYDVLTVTVSGARVSNLAYFTDKAKIMAQVTVCAILKILIVFHDVLFSNRKRHVLLRRSHLRPSQLAHRAREKK